MRTMHLIESAHTGPAATGAYSFVSITAHGAIVLAALYATTRPAVAREPAPDERVYYVPERRPAPVAPAAPVTRATPARRAAPVQVKVAATPVATPSVVPSVVPAVEVPLTDPSVAAPVAPVSDGGAPVGDAAGEGGRSGPYEAGEVEIPAAPLSKSGPAYPERAIRFALSGSVLARFIVGADGRVENDVAILDSTVPDFTAAVRTFLRTAQYRPARVGGRPVRQLVEQRFVFQLGR